MTEPAVVVDAEPSADDRNYAAGLHLSGLASLFFGLGFLGPLIMWLIRKDESEFVNEHGKAAVNFHVSMLIWQMAALLMILTIVGILVAIPALIVLLVVQFLMPIIATIRASAGNPAGYIFAIQLVK